MSSCFSDSPFNSACISDCFSDNPFNSACISDCFSDNPFNSACISDCFSDNPFNSACMPSCRLDKSFTSPESSITACNITLFVTYCDIPLPPSFFLLYETKASFYYEIHVVAFFRSYFRVKNLGVFHYYTLPTWIVKELLKYCHIMSLIDVLKKKEAYGI